MNKFYHRLLLLLPKQLKLKLPSHVKEKIYHQFLQLIEIAAKCSQKSGKQNKLHQTRTILLPPSIV